MPRSVFLRLLQCRAYICPRCAPRQRSEIVSKRLLHGTALRRRNEVQDPFRAGDSAGTAAPRDILSLLEERGYIKDIAGDRQTLNHALINRQAGFYAGIDPTAPSLHLGHLLPLMVLFWLYIHGHHVVSLVGGATAKVGDPSGRLTSRQQTNASAQLQNVVSMHTQLKGLWNSAEQYGRRHGFIPEESWKRELLNNATWLDKLGILDFLCMMGTGMRIGTMLGRDTVKNKLEKGDGMSFAEFTYPLLQAWDWWQMYYTKGVQIQVGGSDQYGNIVAGMDAVKHIAQNHPDAALRKRWLDDDGKFKEGLLPMGLTVPLLTTSSGEKFGKSAGNAIWLDRSLTSAFDLYGFLLRSSDAEVERYLKLFTFVPLRDIARVMTEHASNPGERKAQHLLAQEVLELVYGATEARKTSEEHRMMRKPSLASLSKIHGPTPKDQPASSDVYKSPGSDKVLETAQKLDPNRVQLPRSWVKSIYLSTLLRHAGLAKSHSGARRLLAGGSVYLGVQRNSTDSLGFERITDGLRVADLQKYIKDDMLVVRVGKWKTRIVQIVDDDEDEAEG